MTRAKIRSAGAAALALSLGWLVSAGAADEKPLLRLRAHAVDLGGPTVEGSRRPTTTQLDIAVERLTTEEEAGRLAAVLAEKGADALLRELQKLPRVGRISTPGTLAWDLHYARRIELSGGGQRVVFASDRPMNFFELWNRPRSVDYQYMFGEVRIDADGKGRGTLVPAARVEYNERTKAIEVENYSTQPVRLQDVRVED
jgi:hypothetical protein